MAWAMWYRDVVRLHGSDKIGVGSLEDVVFMTDRIEQAELLVESGQATEALTLLQQILKDQPNLLRAHSLCAAALMIMNQPQAACVHLEAFVGRIDKFPNPVRARVGIAQRFANAGALDRADELLEQAQQLQPDDPAIIAKRADLLMRRKAWRDALALYSEALETLPEHPELLSSAGIAAQQSGDLAEAVDYYRRSLAGAPQQSLVHHNLMAALLRLGHANEALEQCDTWRRYSPCDIEAMSFHALLLAETGQNDEAAVWFDFDRLVHSYRIEAPAHYADLDNFNRALEDHVLGHPDLATPPEDHPTWHHPALKIGSQINAAKNGPVADLEALMEDAVGRYFAHTGDPGGHPFLEHRPKNYFITAWAAVLEGEGNQQPHIHMDGYLSGCYYITIPPEISADDNGSDGILKGGFEIGPPPEELNITANIARRTIKPSEGLMVLFPAYMYHGTIPFKSRERRICIAFDVIPEAA